mmetsp:Transcript_32000/g.51489  ORF Transcript_32000/g.51489 Transcript_32000/m.51489 type:complete len:360 (-) Transcript_32000:745-1824(-)
MYQALRDPSARPSSLRARARYLTILAAVACGLTFAFVAISSSRYEDVSAPSPVSRNIFAQSVMSPRAAPVVSRNWRTILRPRALDKKIVNFGELAGAFGDAFQDFTGVAKEASCKGDELSGYIEKGYKILDVRPSNEVAQIRPKGSVSVEFAPMVENGRAKSMLAENKNFLQAVRKKNFRKNAKIVVACGDGPLSLIACKQLQEAGYKDATWLAGGLANVPSGVLDSDGDRISVGYASSLGKAGRFANGVLTSLIDVGGRLGKSAFEEAKKIDYEELRDISADLSQKALGEIEKIDLDQLKGEAKDVYTKALSEIKTLEEDTRDARSDITSKAKDISTKAWQKLKDLHRKAQEGGKNDA